MTDRRAICCRSPQEDCCANSPPYHCEECEAGLPWGNPSDWDAVVDGLCASDIKVTFSGTYKGTYGDMLPYPWIISDVDFYVLYPTYSDMSTYDMAGGGTVKLKYVGEGEDCDSDPLHVYFIADTGLQNPADGLYITREDVVDTTEYDWVSIGYDGTGGASLVTCTSHAGSESIRFNWTGGTYDGDECVVNANNQVPRVAQCIEDLGRGLSATPQHYGLLGRGYKVTDSSINITSYTDYLSYTVHSKFKWQMYVAMAIVDSATHTAIQDYTAGGNIPDISEDQIDPMLIKVSTTYDWMAPNYCRSAAFDTSMCIENMTFTNPESGDPCDEELCTSPGWDCTYNSITASVEVDT